ncbi:MAG TPA: hypothetical protein VI911_08075 [Patescibacteria group bacterium]|nr:hypothetical protein [Patescibacteria group bacterium]
MEGVQDRDERNRLRKVMMKAEEEKLMSRSEAGFVVTLIERFRQEIEKKQRQLSLLQGELGQLRANEKIIVDLVDSIIRAAERDKARQATMLKLRGVVIEDNIDTVPESTISKNVDDIMYEEELDNSGE